MTGEEAAVKIRQYSRTWGQTAHSRSPSKSAFDRSCLPSPTTYFDSVNLSLLGQGTWRSAVCPFHDDTRPSLRVHIESGCFKCMACGAHGGDVLAFHMRLHDLPFVEAAKALGAWRRS